MSCSFLGTIDNQGDVFCAMKGGYSGSAPLSYLQMQLYLLCEEKCVWPRLGHVHRENNSWADELSKGLTADWLQERRIHPCIGLEDLSLLADLLGEQCGL